MSRKTYRKQQSLSPDAQTKNNINKERLTSLTDAMILLGHTQKSVTNLRRDLMRYVLPPDFKTLCDTTTEASNTLLYGDDIKQSLKDAQEHRRLTASLQQEFRFKRSTPTGPFLGRGGRGRANQTTSRPFAPKYRMNKNH